MSAHEYFEKIYGDEPELPRRLKGKMEHYCSMDPADELKRHIKDHTDLMIRANTGNNMYLYRHQYETLNMPLFTQVSPQLIDREDIEVRPLESPLYQHRNGSGNVETDIDMNWEVIKNIMENYENVLDWYQHMVELNSLPGFGFDRPLIHHGENWEYREQFRFIRIRRRLNKGVKSIERSYKKGKRSYWD